MICGLHKTNEEFSKPSSSSDDEEHAFFFWFYNSSSDGCSTSSSDGEVWENSDTEEDIAVARSVQYAQSFFWHFLCVFFIYFTDCQRKVPVPLNFLKTLLSLVARVSYLR